MADRPLTAVTTSALSWAIIWVAYCLQARSLVRMVHVEVTDKYQGDRFVGVAWPIYVVYLVHVKLV